MQDVMVTIEEPAVNPDGSTQIITKKVKTTDQAIGYFQKVFGQYFKGVEYIDKDGNPISKQANDGLSPRERAFKAMQQRAKDLKIKGWHKMDEKTLIDAIQKSASN